MKLKIETLISRWVCSAILLVGGVSSGLAREAVESITFDGGSGLIFNDSATDDGEMVVVLEGDDSNSIVGLETNKRVLTLGTEENFQSYFPGMSHGSLDILWGPYQEGARFGLFFYGGKWESTAVILVEADSEFGSQADIDEQLSEAATAQEEAMGTEHADYYVFTFSPGSVVDPGGELMITDPVEVTINYLGQVPVRGGPDMEWTEDAPSVEGTLNVLMSRGDYGPEAKVLGSANATGGGGAAAGEIDDAKSKDHSAAAFKALRAEIDAALESETVRKVKVHRDSEVPGRKLNAMGYVEAYVIKQLVYVDSKDEENETYVIYYFRDGLLVSTFTVREGRDTGIEGVAKQVEIMNFDNEKLVGWIVDGEEYSNEDLQYAATDAILAEATERSQPIYEKIGAD